MKISNPDPDHGALIAGAVGVDASGAATDAAIDHGAATSAHPAASVPIADGVSYWPMLSLTSQVGTGRLAAANVEAAVAEIASALGLTDAPVNYWPMLGLTSGLGPGAVPHFTAPTGAHQASAISVADAGAYFATKNVEAALQQVGAAAGVTLSSAVPFVESGTGTGGVGAKASRDDHVHPAAAGGGGLSVTTKGDLQGYSTVAARIPVGTDGQVLTADSAQALGVKWAAGGGGGGSLSGASYVRSAGDYATSSTSFVDVDGTNVSFTITTGAHRVMMGFVGMVFCGTAGVQMWMTWNIDGTDIGGAAGAFLGLSTDTARYLNGSFTLLSSVLSAGSHTIKMRFRTSAGTMTIKGSTTEQSQFWVMEQGG